MIWMSSLSRAIFTNSRPTSLRNVFFKCSGSRKRYADVISDHAGSCFEISCGARLAISRLPRCSATSSVPCLNSVLFQYGSKSSVSFIAAAKFRYASARRSCSVNALEKRNLGLACANATGMAPAAISDVPAARNERRSKREAGYMTPPGVWVRRWLSARRRIVGRSVFHRRVTISSDTAKYPVSSAGEAAAAARAAHDPHVDPRKHPRDHARRRHALPTHSLGRHFRAPRAGTEADARAHARRLRDEHRHAA